MQVGTGMAARSGHMVQWAGEVPGANECSPQEAGRRAEAGVAEVVLTAHSPRRAMLDHAGTPLDWKASRVLLPTDWLRRAQTAASPGAQGPAIV